MCCLVDVCCDVLEECTASIYRMTESGAEVIGRKQLCYLGKGGGHLANQSYGV